MYVRVFSPAGEMFEVIRERADHLLLIEGWTQTAPRDAEPEWDEPAPEPEAVEPEPEEDEPAPEPSETPRKRASRAED
jgi:hypothetical protein